MKWAKFSCSSGHDAFADKHISLPSDYWAQMDVYIPSSTLTACDGELNGYTAFLLSILDSSGSHLERDAIYGSTPDSGATWEWGTDDGFTAASGLTPDTTHTLKVHWNGSTATWYADGASFVTNSVSPAPNGGIRIGAYFSEGCLCEWYFVTNVKIGTSNGGSDIFSEDFSGGDFSAFTSISGDCVVVTSPSLCVPATLSLSPNSGCVEDTITVTGTGFSADSAITAFLDGTPITLTPAITDGSGNVDSTFIVPPLYACTGCIYTLLILDADLNGGTVNFKACCSHLSDTVDVAFTEMGSLITDGTFDFATSYELGHFDGATWAAFGTATPDPSIFSDFTMINSYEPITVYKIPDDGSATSTYTIDLLPTFDLAKPVNALNFLGGTSSSDPCGSVLNNWSRVWWFQTWAKDVLDMQFVDDGTNQWLFVLTRETVEYPFDDGGIDPAYFTGAGYITDRTLTGSDGDLPYRPIIHNITGTLAFTHIEAYCTITCRGEADSGMYRIPKVIAFLNTGSGFTKIGEVAAKYANYGVALNGDLGNDQLGGLFISGISCAAHSSEAGVAHLVWSEGGQWGDTTLATTGSDGCCKNLIWDGGPQNLDYRVVHAVFDTGGKISEDDIWHTHFDRQNRYFVFDD